MKKLTVALLLTIALVGAAIASPVELEGFLGTEIEYRPDRPDEDLRGTTYLRLGYLSQLNQDIKAVFGMRLQADEFSSINNWYGQDLGFEPFVYAYIVAKGSLWEGAQPLQMTMGSLNINYSPYVATFGYNARSYRQLDRAIS